MSRSKFSLTENQQNRADKFMFRHSKECPEISKENREFMETEEQATICSSYKFSFVDMGICDDCSISCIICGESKTLEMSAQELDQI